MQDELYIRRCIELAQKALGRTYPNPLVGSVIVHSGEIIGEGYHHKAGEPHAEINAINSVINKDLIPESTIYVSLEPCAHYGKTPPCALKIKELGFKKVVIGAMDSHDKVNGKGKKIIQDAGIEVVSGILEKESVELNKRFFTYHEKKRPYIILKWAESKDGFLDKDFKPTSISNSLVNQFVHQLRADEHAILVGTQTALNDNPGLTVRNVEGVNPVRILIDLNLKVPDNFKIFNKEAKTLVLNSIKEGNEENIHWIKIRKDDFISDLMDILYQEQIQSVIIEGGRFTLQQFIDANLWDEAIVIKNENLILEKGTQAPEFHSEPFKTETVRDNTIAFHTSRMV
ncbi:bifunctional diaminohydroxyphosphoribosylaminopyrimidine deaminase/5-amino-6-(5-phosphoribosylamino)uracil reductase RibD [Chryseobacterium sp. PTM-20240506]|uniref:bifunctional diaminohydroxyphosphoribosylaminopyrimidine deaminase/5-amino-6-(5-phosphoribosylamino)uracil reductase RibD n=1 Tax=unclassified Chryseobacterium TaxID=2593645 RepID=UPI0023582697|nr:MULTISPECIES: bifunctional diaminohydroxyphosphoribosylaminopyrimidine deaminase/5-amino-6-(5-phosphoribosylamino)uracil reductase RibD [unclassified Chryseobacterium]MDC8106696.1 bifunctional diaminohydroxyphosphoribosylaminopyrimidine deaminase/5-amino-6-(5-phosphoribosylamino)uracil reductase RibD [Chryseobacterium sp. B21-037]MDQ1806025.1 bifunctional diaminohydroxyphosphoribosylaminopyrimidine deaminase/5-amino-6-(5-phosphoribosylamino)uracil reductase RibD [Chryseobacterium sp. CKR4-1]